MEIFSFLIVLVGIVLIIVGGIIDLIQAMQIGWVWVLLYLLVPFAGLVFIIKFWSHKWVRNGFLMSLFGTLLVFSISVVSTITARSTSSTESPFNNFTSTEYSVHQRCQMIVAESGSGNFKCQELKPEDIFPQAVRLATAAAEKTQTAKSKEEWMEIAQTWNQAIYEMESVPDSDPNYAVAIKKIDEYQKNLSYAQKNAQ
jgi:hypothetical protein